MIDKLTRTPGIYLVGFMACGKSTIGQALAKRLGWPFADADDDVEWRRQRKISEIFDTEGEEAFRRYETEAIRAHAASVEGGRPLVLALGGGAFTKPENIALLEHVGATVWLDCPFDQVKRRVAEATHRPLARDPEKFAELYQSRRESYAQAQFHVSVEGDDPSIAVAEIMKLLALK
jgi:shikimate kinase